MSAGNIREIVVSNNGMYDASIYIITGAGTPYALKPQVEANEHDVAFDLSKVAGLRNGDSIQVRVVSGQAVACTDPTIFTYNRNNLKDAATFALAGTAQAPIISFQAPFCMPVEPTIRAVADPKPLQSYTVTWSGASASVPLPSPPLENVTRSSATECYSPTSSSSAESVIAGPELDCSVPAPKTPIAEPKRTHARSPSPTQLKSLLLIRRKSLDLTKYIVPATPSLPTSDAADLDKLRVDINETRYLVVQIQNQVMEHHNEIAQLTLEIRDAASKQAASQKTMEAMLQQIISTQSAAPSFATSHGSELDNLRADVNETRDMVMQIQSRDEITQLTTEIREVASRQAASQKMTEDILQLIVSNQSAAAPSYSTTDASELVDLRADVNETKDIVMQIHNRNEITQLTTEIREVASWQSASQKMTEDILQYIVSNQSAASSFPATDGSELVNLRSDVNEIKDIVAQIQNRDETTQVITEIREEANKLAASQRTMENMLQEIVSNQWTAPFTIDNSEIVDLRADVNEIRDIVMQVQNRDESTQVATEIRELANRQAASQKMTEDILQYIVSNQSAAPSFPTADDSELVNLRADVNETKDIVTQIQNGEEIAQLTTEIREMANCQAISQKTTADILQLIVSNQSVTPAFPTTDGSELVNLREEINETREIVRQIRNRDEIAQLTTEIREVANRQAASQKTLEDMLQHIILKQNQVQDDGDSKPSLNRPRANSSVESLQQATSFVSAASVAARAQTSFAARAQTSFATLAQPTAQYVQYTLARAPSPAHSQHTLESGYTLQQATTASVPAQVSISALPQPAATSATQYMQYTLARAPSPAPPAKATAIPVQMSTGRLGEVDFRNDADWSGLAHNFNGINASSPSSIYLMLTPSQESSLLHAGVGVAN
ncbi:hypothetical protein BDP27DRAFT_1424199 [Rhodocollybia butyracea]|uniref:Uncharacterized protein n=1 Tax=Rhodocollybia butyracea TaxID=206335 RepID=A0A9P5PQD8_9AGAR|nr:hypothetical protein BDP27DRAFT_1424199 [Rhodocollybia butyracea]